jgi:hypothetical protein
MGRLIIGNGQKAKGRDEYTTDLCLLFYKQGDHGYYYRNP